MIKTNLDSLLHLRLMQIALRQNKTMSDVIEMLLDEYNINHPTTEPLTLADSMAKQNRR